MTEPDHGELKDCLDCHGTQYYNGDEELWLHETNNEPNCPMTDPELNDSSSTRYIVERHDATTAENWSKMGEPDAIAPHDNFIEALDDALRLAQKQYNGNEMNVNTNTYPECIEFYEPGQSGCVRLRPAEMTTAYTEFDL